MSSGGIPQVPLETYLLLGKINDVWQNFYFIFVCLIRVLIYLEQAPPCTKQTEQKNKSGPVTICAPICHL